MTILIFNVNFQYTFDFLFIMQTTYLVTEKMALSSYFKGNSAVFRWDGWGRERGVFLQMSLSASFFGIFQFIKSSEDHISMDDLYCIFSFFSNKANEFV